MRWTGERVSSLLNLPRETAVEAAPSDDAVAWGYTLEKLQDRLNRVPDRASPSCSKGASAVLASLQKAAISFCHVNCRGIEHRKAASAVAFRAVFAAVSV